MNLNVFLLTKNTGLKKLNILIKTNFNFYYDSTKPMTKNYSYELAIWGYGGEHHIGVLENDKPSMG